MKKKINDNITICSCILKNTKSTIYLAKDKAKKRYVVKSINEKHISSAKIRDKFNNEATFLGRINHKHIPKLYNFVSTPEMIFIQMDFLDGINLHDYVVSNGRILNVALLKNVTIQLLDITQYLHENFILHLDIKPTNIIITPENEIKLFDFEAAQELNEQTKTDSSEIYLASFSFASPEQVLLTQSINQCSDIYSIGLTIYFLSTGVIPFVCKIINPLDKATEGLIDYSLISNSTLREIIKKATNIDKEKRYKSCLEFKKAIESINEEMSDVFSLKKFNPEDFVRMSLIKRQFYNIIQKNQSIQSIIPLKGISLIHSLYCDSIERELSDMDIYVPKLQIKEFICNMHEIGYEIRDEQFSKDSIVLAKQKFVMVHRENRFVEVDVHLGLITKKFFQLSMSPFCDFAENRVEKKIFEDIEIILLNPVDEWLILAQHGCFHSFANEKWIKDLFLLQKNFTKEQVDDLLLVASAFGFQKVLKATRIHLLRYWDEKYLNIPLIDVRTSKAYDVLLKKSYCTLKRNMRNKLLLIFWEFYFIDDFSDFLKAFSRLVFPSFGLFHAIYKTKNNLIYFSLLPIHICSTSLLFFITDIMLRIDSFKK